MKRKSDRLEAIRIIISSGGIKNQNDLQVALHNIGIRTTQATLSRDLKQLRVAKMAHPMGGYEYVLEERRNYRRVVNSRLLENRQTERVHVRFSGNIAVIRTLPGHADGIAYDIDNMHIEEIIGTIAGDDTIMIVLAQEAQRSVVVEKLSQLLPELIYNEIGLLF